MPVMMRDGFHIFSVKWFVRQRWHICGEQNLLYFPHFESSQLNICCFSSLTAALLTDPVVVTELIKEEELKVKQLIEKYSDKMKMLHVSNIPSHLVIHIRHFWYRSEITSLRNDQYSFHVCAKL